MERDKALELLRKVLDAARRGELEEVADMIEARDKVIGRYQSIFSPASLPNLEAEDFKGFLRMSNNHHWKGISRHSGKMTDDMTLLRRALSILVDESRSLEDRLRDLRPKNKDPMVKGLARSVITPILLVSYPDKYGVLNQIAETAMQKMGVWPSIPAGADFATEYTLVNEQLVAIAKELGTDLWTLDGLWWRLAGDDDLGNDDVDDGDVALEARFGLERHLHEFLFDNWAQTELGKEWHLFEKDDEPVGYKYRTEDVGEIDLLARHNSENRWLVVELKRGRTSDKVVGQLLRYRGWVMEHLAKPDDVVEGLIIGHSVDKKLMYALKGLGATVRVRTYEVSFSLHEPSL